MASFQDKIGWKTQGKRENKNCRFVLFRSYPMRNRKFPKNRKKIQQYHFGIISSQNRFRKCREREKIKILFPFHSNTMRNKKFKKNSKKIEKFKKYRYVFFSSQNRFDKEEKGTK